MKTSYSLRRGLNAWLLTFGGQPAVLKHETGLTYVAYLLYHPGGEGLHAVELRLRSLHPAAVGREDVVLERFSGVDDMESARALYRKQCQLKSVLDDPEQSEPVRAEAQRELEEIEAYFRTNLHHTSDQARKAANAVRKAITRFHRKLEGALDSVGRPHAVLRAFARHLEEALLAPSTRCARCGPEAGSGMNCRFRYQPPNGIRWRE